MREHIKNEVFKLIARELGIPRQILTEETCLGSNTWYEMALLCDALIGNNLIADWKRPNGNSEIKGIIDVITTNNLLEAVSPIRLAGFDASRCA